VSEPVTAVVPTRNRLPLLRQTLGSILDQRGCEVRVVVVDEGSHDGTGEFLAALGDPRVEALTNQRPLGVSGARNVGIAAARTRWVGVCDDDDLWAPTKVAEQLAALAARTDARWCVCDTVLVDDDLQVVGHRTMSDQGDALAGLLVTNTVPATSGLLFEKALFDEVGAFEVGLNESEDWELAIRLARASPVAVAEGPLVAYRMTGAGLSSKTEKMRASFELIRSRYADLAAAEGVEFDEHGYERYLAQSALRGGDRIGAARSFWRIGVEQHSPKDLARAGAALTVPRTFDRKGDERARAAVPPAWLLEARTWLSSVPLAGASPGTPA